MTNLTSNTLFDKAFPNERVNCTKPLKTKEFEKDVKYIFTCEKIIDYRCYLNEIEQVVYYMVETQTTYIAYKNDLIKKDVVALACEKGELER